MPRRCAFGCEAADAVLHVFPNPGRFPDRFKVWVNLVGGKLETSLDYEYYKKKRICDIHFTNDHKNRFNRLNTLAVPSLYLPRPNAPLHKFPNPAKNKDMFNTWLYLVGGHILGLEDDHIYKYRRVCHQHFETKYCCYHNRLSNIAVPTKNLPGFSSHKFTAVEQQRIIQNLPENKPSTSGYNILHEHNYNKPQDDTDDTSEAVLVIGRPGEDFHEHPSCAQRENVTAVTEKEAAIQVTPSSTREAGSEKEILHKFPNPEKEPERFRTWLYNVGGNVLVLDNTTIVKSRRVCHLHFETRYHTRSKFLSVDAIPRLFLPEHGIIPERTKDTANFIIFINNLFDSLNGCMKNSAIWSGKDLLRNVTPTSKHEEVWMQAKLILKLMKFVTPKGSASCEDCMRIAQSQFAQMTFNPITSTPAPESVKDVLFLHYCSICTQSS